MKHRKPKAARKDDQIRIRVSAEQKALFTQAAEQAGLDVSSWLRRLGLKAVGRITDA
jgi:uncharacterized protein (DUF1778 family)